ncbi:MAG: nitroreductase family protein [Draconibacterium sp.]
MELLHKHVSIRKFQKRKIQRELLESLLYSGTRASTTGNMQLYSIIINEDGNKKDELVPLHFNQSVAVNAPVLLTFVADFNRFSEWCRLRNATPGYDNFLSFFTAAIDALLVAQNVCIAAENAGLGVCYLGTTTYNAKEIIQVLQLPKLTFPITTVALGYPDENPGLTDRLPLQGVIHFETYSNYGETKLKELYQYKEELASSKKFIEENGKETLAQVFTDIRYNKKDNEFFSGKMIETLREQGFIE